MSFPELKPSGLQTLDEGENLYREGELRVWAQALAKSIDLTHCAWHKRTCASCGAMMAVREELLRVSVGKTK
jgi:hypothetical protein